MNYGIYLGRDWTYPEIRAVTQEAERLGFTSAWYEDNITGHPPIARETPGFDVWTLLPALAEATSTIRLGSLVTPVPRRHAPLLAFSAASLDVISNGRLNMGLGAGDDHQQYEMLGQDFPMDRKQRLQMLREAIELMRLLWLEDSANYEGQHYRLQDAMINYKPQQKPSPPIYVACNTSRKLVPHIAAEVGDAIAVMWGHDPTVFEILNNFKARWQEVGRNPAELITARTVFLVICDEDCDWQRDFGELTGISLDYEEHASEAEIPEGSDPVCFIAGTPEHATNEIQRRVIEPGFTNVIFNFTGLGSFADKLETNDLSGVAGNFLGTMRLAAEHIIPHL